MSITIFECTCPTCGVVFLLGATSDKAARLNDLFLCQSCINAELEKHLSADNEGLPRTK